jgi:hypothetical protein
MTREWKGPFRDLVDVRGTEGQLPQYASVLTGTRKSMDDWIPVSRFDAYERLARRLGLVIRVDCVFKSRAASDNVLGSEYAPTTRARGCLLADVLIDDPLADVHVVVSKRSDWADDTLAAAWYSVAVNNRVLTKPTIDHVRLGLAFGYPECCVRSFHRYNNWGHYCTLTEALRRSRALYWETNCLPRNTQWMTIFHLPCSFDCVRTRDQSREVLSAVREFDVEYADLIERFMRLPYLMINEKLAYALIGGTMIGPTRAVFDRAVDVYANTSFRERRDDLRSRALSASNEVVVTDDAVVASRDGRIVDVLELRCDRGIIEVPSLLDFSR